ncbi:MAG: 2-oxoisovalerate dehydrogenase [Chloroflexota bacterium]|nr:2-oxoisovalerate dehydrogenase [Chloroflexota bacterium]
MNEIIFLVNENENGEYSASAMGRAISITASSWDELKFLAQREILRFFENGKHPQSIRLHLIKEEVLTLES